ncbi:hypothetical protein ADL12_07110 [Streptomyces regalis]|uniref:Uncharacterized protein n=1 Tax=Streptomyces regalis TaxID=68262 RepID=A0A0X3VFR0_9ACTN|nr:hypothetical protein ADL12_07110 [Streptomyces regalis]
MRARPAAGGQFGGAPRVVGVEAGEGELGEFGVLERYGSAFAPAGEISSVERLSPHLSRTGPFSTSGSGSKSGRPEMLGPHFSSMRAACSGGSAARTSRG